MNEELVKLYSLCWNALNARLGPIIADENIKIKPANPFLLYVDNEEDYRSADIRLMIFGQETNSWYEKGTGTLEEIQSNYDGFFNEGECWSYGGQFWNGVSKFLASLQNKYKEKKVRLLWNNIIKIGKHEEKGLPPDYIYKAERETFHVIPQELTILKPNVVVQTTTV